MGYNIAGIVINENLENKSDEISKILNLDIEFDEEVDFGAAIENWKEDDILDVYYSDKGTLIFLNFDYCTEPHFSEKHKILTFALSETSMAFNFEYTEENKLVYSLMEVNGEIVNEEGEKVPRRDEDSDTSGLIWEQIENVLGKSFWDIDFEEEAYRYYIVKN